MAGTPNPEGVVEAAISVLTSDLPAKLLSLDSEYNDGITLATVAKFWRNYAAQDQYDEVPACIVTCSEGEIQFRTYRIYDHEFTIHYVFVGNDVISGFQPQEVLTKRLQRTIRATIEILENKPKLTISGSDYCDRFIVERVNYSDTFTDGQEFRRDGLLTCLARTSTP